VRNDAGPSKDYGMAWWASTWWAWADFSRAQLGRIREMGIAQRGLVGLMQGFVMPRPRCQFRTLPRRAHETFRDHDRQVSHIVEQSVMSVMWL
jgi:hypothetical protein